MRLAPRDNPPTVVGQVQAAGPAPVGGVPLPSRRERMANRYAAWMAAWRRADEGFVIRPEPRVFGNFVLGKQLLAGDMPFLPGGTLPQGGTIWDVEPPDRAVLEELHGFSWLEDLAALGSVPARRLAQAWLAAWLSRFGRGRGPGWTPALTGRRLLRQIFHSGFLLKGAEPSFSSTFFTGLARQAEFLRRRARKAPRGLPRFEALVGLLLAGVTLRGRAALIPAALEALSLECDTAIDDSGAIASRNPEELAEILLHLSWAVQLLVEADHPVPPALSRAIDRAAAVLRVLRHVDGSLPRFHGGGAGREGRLDLALSASSARLAGRHVREAMGYVRLSAGRTSVIVDATSPPGGAASARAHASTGAFELTVNRHPLVINCGSGLAFGEDWEMASRATPLHSAMEIVGYSSSRFGRRGKAGLLTERARVSSLETGEAEGPALLMAHDGWLPTHGLLAVRELALAEDGRRLSGWDMLSAALPEGKERLRRLRKNEGRVAIAIRFHLHPEVEAAIDMGGIAVSLWLTTGERWIFRHDGQSRLSLEPSVYLESGQEGPRGTQQIVLSAMLADFEARIGWTLVKAQDTAQGHT